jgi:FKBP12-rapamycin complex-associated protein
MNNMRVVAQPVSKMVPPQRMTPAAEDFYPTVAIQALTRIFKDPSLAVHHGMVMQAIMFIFNSLGQKCVPFLGKVVPHILFTIRTCSASNLREARSKQVASLSVIVNEHLRPYVAEIFDIVDELWETRHLGTILTSVTMIAAGVPDDFRKFVPRLVRKLLSSLDDVQTSDWFKPSGRQGISDKASVEFDKLELILRSLKSLRGVLGDYLHVLVTSLLKLADALITASSSADTDEDNRAAFTRASIETLKTISHLLEHDSVRPSTEMPAASWA